MKECKRPYAIPKLSVLLLKYHFPQVASIVLEAVAFNSFLGN